jgi:hypothetical protein
MDAESCEKDVGQGKIAPEPAAGCAEPPAAVELHALVRRAQAGDPGALPRIREILDDRPEIWQHVGDLAALVEQAWIAVLAAENPLAVEAMRRSVAEMRRELEGEHATRLEKMMIDQVLATWLECKYLEGISAEPGRGSLDQAAFRLRRLESSQKRYLNAVKMLTTVRTLLPAGLAPAQAIRLHAGGERQRA